MAPENNQVTTFELRLVDRYDDRVVISVCLFPPSSGVRVENVALQLRCRSGNALGPRLVPAIAGDLRGPMVSTVEVRSDDGIPPGAQIAATAWIDGVAVDTTCPADPFTELEAHMRGSRLCLGCFGADDERLMRPLSADERLALAETFPWIEHGFATSDTTVLDREALDTVPPEDEEVEPVMPGCAGVDEVHSFCSMYGLGAEDAAWLEELMTEE